MVDRTPYLSIIFPAYNEAATIRKTLDLAFAFLDAQPYAYELVVVADGDDGTREEARASAEAGRGLIVLGEVARRGKGHGVRAGVRAASGQVIGYVDADNKTPIEEVARMLPWLDQGFDLAIGSRAGADSAVTRQQPLYRRVGSRVFSVAMHVTTGLWQIRDTQCGFKFFRAAIAKDLFSRQRIDGYMFDVEILSLAVQSGYRIKEVGIRWADDGDSRLELVSGNWRNMVDLLTIGWRSVRR